MTRAFSPSTLPGQSREAFKVMREDALRCSGEWVRHMPCDGETQFVVMHFQHIPDLASINPEYAVYNADSILWGLADHFEIVPSVFHDGHSGKLKRGSQFEIQGFVYDVKAAPVNHNGYIRVFLSRSDKCAAVNCEFAVEVQELSPC